METIKPKEKRYEQILTVIKDKKLAGFGQFNAKTGEKNPPIEQRELTQQEAAKWCGVAPATLHKWSENGLKCIIYGQRKRYLLRDIEEFIRQISISC